MKFGKLAYLIIVLMILSVILPYFSLDTARALDAASFSISEESPITITTGEKLFGAFEFTKHPFLCRVYRSFY